MIITKHPTSVIKIISITAVCVAIVIGVLLHLQSISRAADLSKFNPGNIMSDAVMSNKSTMSVQQIQAFLDSKNPCDNKNTYMAGWYPHLSYTIRDGKFVCMAKDSFNGKSAAQIIWQAGQDYSINPQVLLVLLEKEQGLISDTWPNNVQYRTATGFGCPDTAPCEAQYFGLENQVRLAANLFRTVLNGGWSNYPVGQTYVQYHPQSSCGGTVVNIQNRATSALYRYTPYQPNRAALNAGYGTGDGCSAYGNRNFYALFTDWFGSAYTETFREMDQPRQLYTKSQTVKINPITGQKTEDLPAGLVINFRQKAVYSGQTCLRTAIDTNLNKEMCVLETNLSEVFSSMLAPRKLVTKEVTSKIDTATGQKTEDLPAGLEISFSQLTYQPSNTLCLRTEIDKGLSKNMCVPYGSLHELESIFRSMDIPRYFEAKRDINKVNPITGNVIEGQTIKKGQRVWFSSRTSIDNTPLCLRTEANTLTNSNMCFLYEDLLET